MSEKNVIEYDEIESKLSEVKEASDFLPDVTTTEGYDKSKRVSLDVGKLLTALDKKRKEKKAFYIEGGKRVDTQAKSIAKQLEEMQLPHKQAYKDLDNLKKEREANRKAAIEERVLAIVNIADMMRDAHSSEILQAMNEMKDEECLDFYEYTEQALKARNASRQSLGDMFARVSKEEAEKAELDKLRKDAAKRAENDREEEIKRRATDSVRLEFEKVQKENEEARKSEAERREKDRGNIARVRGDAKTALMDICDLSEDKAREIVLAINNKDIPHVKINY